MVKMMQQDPFQSTLPHGSDLKRAGIISHPCNFNPRSLTGATLLFSVHFVAFSISIHAPSRERRRRLCSYARHQPYFNPRSLTGATALDVTISIIFALFQSTLPHGSDRVKMKYFYNYVNQAFVANKLNLNSKRFHFDVRKYELSHTSLSCEPKLNLWFIYLRNTKILVYSPHHFKSYACSLRLQAIFPPPRPLHNHYSFWQ